MEFGILSVFPPVLAIILALVLKNVFVALISGVFLGYLILAQGNLFTGINDTLYSFIKVFESNSNTIVIIVCALLGGLTLVIEKSGGISGFVDYMTNKKAIIKSKKGSAFFTWCIGVLVFTSGTLSCLITGAVTRPLNDAMKVSHEKQAFLIHTTSTPVCVLLPLSGWGAFMIGLIEAQGVTNAPQVLVQSIPFNFYCILAVFSILYFTFTGKDYGPMKKAEERAEKLGLLDEPKNSAHVSETAESQTAAHLDIKATSAANLIVPIATMIVVILGVMYTTGNGSLIKGNGHGAIVWGVCASLLVAGAMYIKQKIYTFNDYISDVFKGTGNILPVVSILIFAFAMGGVVKKLDTGTYLANTLSTFLTPALLAALVFVIASLVSFSTGSSMGTHAVMMPLALPIALAMGVNIPLVAAAVFGGGIFGDHTSPISDTTAMSCATTGCDVMDHIRTQMPYALVFAAVSLILYVAVGLVL